MPCAVRAAAVVALSTVAALAFVMCAPWGSSFLSPAKVPPAIALERHIVARGLVEPTTLEPRSPTGHSLSPAAGPVVTSDTEAVKAVQSELQEHPASTRAPGARGPWPSARMRHLAPWCPDSTDAPRSASAAVFSFGDSFGRQLVESLLLRMRPSTLTKIKLHPHDHFAKKVRWPVASPSLNSSVTVTIGQHFDSEASHFGAAAAQLTRFVNLSDAHIVLSRGPWDLLFRGTPLAEYHAAVSRAIRSALAMGVGSIAVRPMHYFPNHGGFLTQCSRAEVIAAYRAVTACAAAAVNRDRDASNPPMGLVAVVDMERDASIAMAQTQDRFHVGVDNSQASMDMVLHNFSCAPWRTATHTNGSVWLSTDWREIARRFECATRVWRHMPPNESSSEVVDDAPLVPDADGAAAAAAGGPSWVANATPGATALRATDIAIRPLELEFGLRDARYGCRCHVAGLNHNDHCSIFFWMHLSRRFKNAAVAIRRYICGMRAAVLRPMPRYGYETNISTALWVDREETHATTVGSAAAWLGELVLESCAGRTAALVALRHAGLATPEADALVLNSSVSQQPVALCHAPDEALHRDVLAAFGPLHVRRATEWCNDLERRLAPVAKDIGALIKSHGAFDGVSSALLRFGNCADPSLRAALEIVCHPQWVRGTLGATKRVASRPNARLIGMWLKYSDDAELVRLLRPFA